MAKEPKGPAFNIGDNVYKINPHHGNLGTHRRGKIIKYIADQNHAGRTLHYYDVLFDNERTPRPKIGQQTLRLIPRTPAETITTKS